MKINRNKFAPLSIEVETEEELRALIVALDVATDIPMGLSLSENQKNDIEELQDVATDMYLDLYRLVPRDYED